MRILRMVTPKRMGVPVENGFFTGSFAGTDGFASGAADGDKVTFVGDEVTNSTFGTSGTGTGSSVADTFTAGEAETGGDISGNEVNFDKVDIRDAGDDSITDVTVDGFGGSSSFGSDVLENLTLRNGSGTTTLATTVTALNVVVDDVSGTLDDDNDSIENLTLTAEGESTTGYSRCRVLD